MTCPRCRGTGQDPEPVPECCGHLRPDGDCCGDPVPAPQACRNCNGEGRVEE